MIKNKSGAIIVTGNTSAHRGKANFGGTASTKAAQKILTESFARYLNPKGVHVAYITIDAAIDLEWTRKAWPDKPDEFFILNLMILLLKYGILPINLNQPGHLIIG